MECEKILAIAVRSKLRTALSLNRDNQCNIEMDELLAAIAFDTQINVIPNGVQPGVYNAPNVKDYMISIAVLPVLRTREQARDKRADVYLEAAKGLAALVESVVVAVDGNSLFAEIEAQGESTCGFVEPLRLVSLENRPKPIFPADYGSKQNQQTGYGRLITFGKARWISG